MLRRAVPVVLGVVGLASAGCGRANFVPVPVDAAMSSMDAALDASRAGDADLDATSPDARALEDAFEVADAFEMADAVEMAMADAFVPPDAPVSVDAGLDAFVASDAFVAPDAFAPPDAGPVTIPEDCAHRWRRTTNISSNFKMYASDVTVVVGGFASVGGVRTDAHAEATGMIAWSRPSIGSFGGGAADRYVVFENTGGGGGNYGVTDMHTGADLTTFSHWYIAGGGGSWRMAVRDDGESLMPTAVGGGVGTWERDVTGSVARLSGPAPGTLLFRHGADGNYRRHVQIADATLSLQPLRVGASEWGVVVSGQSAPATFGAHVVAAGAHELVVLDDGLGFVRTHTFSDRIDGATTLPGAGLLAVRTSSRLVGLDGAGELWSRTDCLGSFLDASRTRLYVAASLGAGTSRFCGVTTASAVGTRFVVVELDPRTGATLGGRWFGLSAGGPRAFSVAGDGDAYVALTGDATACGETGTGTSSENFLIAL